MTISFDEIVSYFLGSITDYDIAEFEEDDANTLFLEYLKKAIAKTYVNHIFDDFSITTDEDNATTITCELERSVNSTLDQYFVLTVLAKAMVVEWLEPQVKSKLNISQYFSGKERNFYSQSAHLEEIKSLYDETVVELRRLIEDRGAFYNSYVDGD